MSDEEKLRLSVVVYEGMPPSHPWECQVLGDSIEPIVFETGVSREAVRRGALRKLRELRDAINDALRLEER